MEQTQKFQLDLAKLAKDFLNHHPIGFEFLKLLHQKGVEARFVGGIVRHFLTSKMHPEIIQKSVHSDYDVCVQATPYHLKNILKDLNLNISQENLSYGTFKIEYKNIHFDLACLRKDIDAKGRHCKVLFIDNFEEDSLRRDFTFNAITVNYEGLIFDYHGGLSDLKGLRVNFIGDPKIRIQEDVLRLLRYVRFCAELHIIPQKKILDEAFKHTKLLNKLPLKRVQYEWEKIKETQYDVSLYLKILQDYQMIQKHEAFLLN